MILLPELELARPFRGRLDPVVTLQSKNKRAIFLVAGRRHGPDARPRCLFGDCVSGEPLAAGDNAQTPRRALGDNAGVRVGLAVLFYRRASRPQRYFASVTPNGPVEWISTTVSASAHR